jgi:cytohesin
LLHGTALELKNFFNAVGRVFKSDPNRVGENGYTKLQTAIVKNDLAKVVSLIKAGADVNLRGSLVYPPLHLALDKDRHSIAIALLQGGADVDLKDAAGKTPLHRAVSQSQEAFVLTLLKMNADPNLQDAQGRTPLHEVSTARPDMVDTLVSHKADPNARDNDGNTPLHAFIDRIPMVERLLNNGADPNVKNDYGVSPYMMLLEEDRLRRYPAVLQKMLAFNADMGSTNQLGETILHLAARLEMDDTFNEVMPGCELCVKDANGNNVLHALVRTQNAGMIAKVLAKAPELLHEKNAKGLTPLGELVRRSGNTPYRIDSKYIATARMMIDAGADPSATDDKGRTLLHCAVEQDQLLFAEYLAGKNIDLDAVDDKGNAALHVAIEKKNLTALDRLLDMGADPDLTDARGWTVLDRLAEKGDRDSPVVQRLIVAAGQYAKQLPLNPELMRKRDGRLEKKHGGLKAVPQPGSLDKTSVPKPRRHGTGGPGLK